MSMCNPEGSINPEIKYRACYIHYANQYPAPKQWGRGRWAKAPTPHLNWGGEDFVDKILSNFYTIYPSAEIGNGNWMMTKTLGFLKIKEKI